MVARLQQEVWALERCSGCGACVAACSKGVLYWDAEQHPLLEQREKVIGLSRFNLRTCQVCEKFCELSCPRLVEWSPLLPLSAISVRAAGVVHSGEPNDVIRSLLVAARAAGLIDGAILPYLDPWTLEMTARVVTSVEEIAGGSGLHYLWSPLLSALNEAIFDRGLTRLAVVGPPCVAEGARRLLQADHSRLHPYQDAIRLTIAAFCTGVYMPGLVAEFIEHSQGIARHRIRSISTSAAEGTLTVLEWDGTQHSLPITGVEPYTRRGCATCDDYLGESADLAVGTVGAEPGYATLIARTPVGGACVQNAVRFRLLEVSPQVDEAALDAARAAKDRRARARAFDEFRILMLDALGDPVKRSVVIKQFARLYGSPQAKPTVKEERYVGCGGCS